MISLDNNADKTELINASLGMVDGIKNTVALLVYKYIESEQNKDSLIDVSELYIEPGRGTTFKILFPASAMTAEDSGSGEAELSDWQADGAVLIIDDEEMIRETAAIMLQDLGFDTITAVDGIDGVSAYQRHQQDIVAVLLDMTMPRLDGEGCFRALRRIDPNVQVILSSGYSEQDATGRFSGKGLAGFVQKPYHPDALRDAMRQLMNDSTG